MFFSSIEMSINGVVLDSDRMPLPINSLEKYKATIGGITLSLQTGLGYPGASNSYYGTGKLVLTSYRMVFISDPPLPLFDSFMVTWNKIEEGKIRRPNRFWTWLGRKDLTFEATVQPLEDENALIGIADLELTSSIADEIELIAKIVKESRWTGHLDPENTAEPPPAYPKETADSPPPNYEDALALSGEIQITADN